MQTTTEAVPTLDEIEAIKQDRNNFLDYGISRSVYRKAGSRWVIKSDYDGGDVNQREYDNYVRVKPSLSHPSLRLPEMHMVGRYLVAEYIEGHEGSSRCWGERVWRDDKAYYTKGCPNSDCENGPNCWAEAVKDLSQTVADLHYANVKITSDNLIYVIDLGEH